MRCWLSIVPKLQFACTQSLCHHVPYHDTRKMDPIVCPNPVSLMGERLKHRTRVCRRLRTRREHVGKFKRVTDARDTTLYAPVPPVPSPKNHDTSPQRVRLSLSFVQLPLIQTHSIRVEFTREHDTFLCKYLATHHPSKEGRRGNTVFQDLVANVRPSTSRFVLA